MDDQKQASFEGWAKVEIMGHQSHVGFVRTEAYGAAVLFRIDTPELPEREYTLDTPQYVNSCWTPAGAKIWRGKAEGSTALVGSGSIYRILPCSEAAAMKAIEQNGRAEFKVIELPVKTLAAGADPFEPTGDDDRGERADPDDIDEEDNPNDIQESI